MKDYQQRVVDEKKELDEKINKLEQFITSEKINSVDPNEAFRLKTQLVTMINYSEILGERIKFFVD
jgi:hypothetical protein